MNLRIVLLFFLLSLSLFNPLFDIITKIKIKEQRKNVNIINTESFEMNFIFLKTNSLYKLKFCKRKFSL